MSAKLTHRPGVTWHVTPLLAEPEPVTLRRVTGSGRKHLAAVAAMHASAQAIAWDQAWEQSKAAEFTVSGKCRSCGSVEVMLLQADGTTDLSSIGEAADYPTGYGCELCA